MHTNLTSTGKSNRYYLWDTLARSGLLEMMHSTGEKSECFYLMLCSIDYIFFYSFNHYWGAHQSAGVCMFDDLCAGMFHNTCAHPWNITGPFAMFFLLTNLRWPTPLGSVNKKKMNIFFLHESTEQNVAWRCETMGERVE